MIDLTMTIVMNDDNDDYDDDGARALYVCLIRKGILCARKVAATHQPICNRSVPLTGDWEVSLGACDEAPAKRLGVTRRFK